MLLFFTYYAMLAVLLKFTYYAQEQELLYSFYMQFCLSNSLHVANNLRLFY